MESTLATQRPLVDLLKQLVGRPFLFVEPGGNHGDSLIWRGARKIAGALHLDAHYISHKDFMTANLDDEAVVYINGSGGLNSIWNRTPLIELGKALVRRNSTTILGPSTFMDDDSYIFNEFLPEIEKVSPTTFYLFCREMTSYDTLKNRCPPWVQLDVNEDTAFYLTAADLLNANECSLPQGRYVLYAQRSDKEAAGFKRSRFTGVWLDPATYCRSFAHWVDVHAHARQIVTNRTHSAILGSILGKDVIMLPNSYHKNSSIWHFSLRQRGVAWQDEVKMTMPMRTFGFLGEKLVRSSKWNRLLRLAAGVPDQGV